MFDGVGCGAEVSTSLQARKPLFYPPISDQCRYRQPTNTQARNLGQVLRLNQLGLQIDIATEGVRRQPERRTNRTCTLLQGDARGTAGIARNQVVGDNLQVFLWDGQGTQHAWPHAARVVV